MKSILQQGGVALCALGLSLGVALVSTAQAQSARPLRVAVPVAYEGACELAPPPGTVRLWLGHFRGGNARKSLVGPPLRSHISVEWTDRYQCFSSRQRCEVWQARLRQAYRGIESTRTCLPIR